MSPNIRGLRGWRPRRRDRIDDPQRWHPALPCLLATHPAAAGIARRWHHGRFRWCHGPLRAREALDRTDAGAASGPERRPPPDQCASPPEAPHSVPATAPAMAAKRALRLFKSNSASLHGTASRTISGSAPNARPAHGVKTQRSAVFDLVPVARVLLPHSPPAAEMTADRIVTLAQVDDEQDILDAARR